MTTLEVLQTQQQRSLDHLQLRFRLALLLQILIMRLPSDKHSLDLLAVRGSLRKGAQLLHLLVVVISLNLVGRALVAQLLRHQRRTEPRTNKNSISFSYSSIRGTISVERRLSYSITEHQQDYGRQQLLLIVGCHNRRILLTEVLVLDSVVLNGKLHKHLSSVVHHLQQIYDELSFTPLLSAVRMKFEMSWY